MSEAIVVSPVRTPAELKKFISFPYRLYKKMLKNPFWAAPLRIDEKTLFNRKKHPFYRHADVQEFLACRDGEVVGRLAGIIDYQHHKYREPGVAYFGFFESIDDQLVASALFEAAVAWARVKGMKRIIGPINLSTNHVLGMLQNDFEGVPMVQVPYNPEYYPALVGAYGFEKEKDHLAYLLKIGEMRLSDKVRRVAAIARKNKRLLVRNVNMKDYWSEVALAKDLYNRAFQHNSDFVPWEDDEFMFMAKDLKLAIVPELTFLAFVDGKLAGISITLYNFNEIFAKMNGRLFPTGIFKLLAGKSKIKSVRLAILGVLPEYRRMGIDALLVLESYEKGVAMGYEAGELSVILEDNWPLVNLLNKWGVPMYRTYRVYQKRLD
jgi:GNAT superfamily N-acetyltransferase